MKRWLCTECQVEWSSTGEDHGPCWFCDSAERVKPTLDVPTWLLGYRYTHEREAS